MKRLCWPKWVRARAGLVAIVALAAGTLANAEEVVVKNDSVVDGSAVAIQAGFVSGESAAAWLTSPCDGDIVAVQIFWKSLFGGTGESLEDSIRIFEGGLFPSPGAELALLEGPVLTDGFLNEFRYLDEEQTVPIEVPVSTGDEFVVSFRFDSNPDPLFGPSVVTDVDGCRGGKNAIQYTSGSWGNLCAEGVSGDLMIRAVVDCVEPQGACCNSNGLCTDGLYAEECARGFDTFFPNQSCVEIECPEWTGACCNGTGGCLQDRTRERCEDVLGGIYAGHGTDCNDGVCQVGACCLLDGTCEQTIELECRDLHGTYRGQGVACEDADCPPPLGACCIGVSCEEDQTHDDCLSFNGVWAGPLTQCYAEMCPICDDGDANGDGQVDLIDFALFQFCYGAPGVDVCKCLDMNNDNHVDLGDYLLFEEELVSGGPG